MAATVHPQDVAEVRARVQHCITAELAHQAQVLAEIGPDINDVLVAINALLTGGKRLRAAFLYWGYRAAGGADGPEVIRLASSMEFFQAAALLHDDVMDDSDTRRGLPAAHRALATHHAGRGWSGEAHRFGLAGAILAGNLCLCWCDELFATCGLPPQELARARGVFDRMRTQLMGGQFLDVVESARPWRDLSDGERLRRADNVIRYKSAKYTIEHPLLIGAIAAGAGDHDLGQLSQYGLDLGHAFQLRDDILGVFGDPEETGKPAGDDLREGKRTVLVAHTLSRAAAAGRQLLTQSLGNADLDQGSIDQVRTVMSDSGAVKAVEAEIDRLTASARAALGATTDLVPDAVKVLEALIGATTARTT